MDHPYYAEDDPIIRAVINSFAFATDAQIKTQTDAFIKAYPEKAHAYENMYQEMKDSMAAQRAKSSAIAKNLHAEVVTPPVVEEAKKPEEKVMHLEDLRGEPQLIGSWSPPRVRNNYPVGREEKKKGPAEEWNTMKARGLVPPDPERTRIRSNPDKDPVLKGVIERDVRLAGEAKSNEERVKVQEEQWGAFAKTHPEKAAAYKDKHETLKEEMSRQEALRSVRVNEIHSEQMKPEIAARYAELHANLEKVKNGNESKEAEKNAEKNKEEENAVKKETTGGDSKEKAKKSGKERKEKTLGQRIAGNLGVGGLAIGGVGLTLIGLAGLEQVLGVAPVVTSAAQFYGVSAGFSMTAVNFLGVGFLDFMAWELFRALSRNNWEGGKSIANDLLSIFNGGKPVFKGGGGGTTAPKRASARGGAQQAGGGHTHP